MNTIKQWTGVIKFWGPHENGDPPPRPHFHRYFGDPLVKMGTLLNRCNDRCKRSSSSGDMVITWVFSHCKCHGNRESKNQSCLAYDIVIVTPDLRHQKRRTDRHFPAKKKISSNIRQVLELSTSLVPRPPFLRGKKGAWGQGYVSACMGGVVLTQVGVAPLKFSLH